MKKRGSHIDIVLSFVIFVTLLIFIFSVFMPKLKISDQQAIIDYLKLKLIGNFSSNLTTFTIQITDPIDQNKKCIKFTGSVEDIIIQGINYDELIIKNSSNYILNYTVQGKTLYILTGKNFDGFLKLYHSPHLNASFCDGSPPSCGMQICDVFTNYEIGLIREITSIILFNIQELADKYNTDYESLKSELGLPPGTEFAFIFTASDGTEIIAEPDEIPTTNVYSEEFPVTYSDNDGNILEGFLTIKVW